MNPVIILIVFAVSAIVVAALGLCARYAAKELQRIAEYEHLSERFFNAVDILIAEPDTPDVVIETLDLLNALITDEKYAKAFFASYCSLAYRRIKSGERVRLPEEYSVFVQNHPNLENVVQDAMFCGLVAMSHLSSGWGQRYRAMLADLYARDRRPSTVIEAVRESRESGKFSPMPIAA